MNSSSLIGHVLELLEKIDHTNQPADRTTSEFFHSKSYLGSHDRKYIGETVFGVIRHRRYAEALLEEFVDRNPQYRILDSPRVRYLAVLAAFSVIARRITDSSIPEITISEVMWKSRFPDVDIHYYERWLEEHFSLEFLPSDQPAVRLGVRYSFQDWMVEEWRNSFGDEVESLLAAFNTPAPTTLRVNLLKATRSDCSARLAEEGIQTRETRISPAGLIGSRRFAAQASAAFKEGWFEVQDEGSQIVSLVAAPMPGTVVIDACAGAGGKALHLADLMNNTGELIAVDVEPKRITELERRSKRAGVTIIRSLLRKEITSGRFDNSADLVVIDAPCSGSGTIRRNPGYKWTLSESLLQHYVSKQTEILEFNAPFVRQGGQLVYATCSLFECENQGVIEKFVAHHPEFSIEKERTFIQAEAGFLILTPHQHHTDGFTIVKLKKIC